MNAQEKMVFDYYIQGVIVKNVPYILNKHDLYEPHLLDGNTLERVYELINENHSKKPVIYYSEGEDE